jgi:hypothetical protein
VTLTVTLKLTVTVTLTLTLALTAIEKKRDPMTLLGSAVLRFYISHLFFFQNSSCVVILVVEMLGFI